MSLLYVELSSANTLRQVLVLAQQPHLGRKEVFVCGVWSVGVFRRTLGTQGNTLGFSLMFFSQSLECEKRQAKGQVQVVHRLAIPWRPHKSYSDRW